MVELQRKGEEREVRKEKLALLTQECSVVSFVGTGETIHALRKRASPRSTPLALMGQMSRAMLERYSHIRTAAKQRDAVVAITLRPKVENSQVVPVKSL
jgi:hypothetical protein